MILARDIWVSLLKSLRPEEVSEKDIIEYVGTVRICIRKETTMLTPDKRTPVDEAVLDIPEPEHDGLGEFNETIIDKDGEVEPVVLEEPDEVEEGYVEWQSNNRNDQTH